MWKYNETDNLPGNSLYHSADELYHYGILGMRWRHRKSQINKINNKKRYSKRPTNKQIDSYVKNTRKNVRRGRIGSTMAIAGAGLYGMARKAKPTNSKELAANRVAKILGASMVGGGSALYVNSNLKNIKNYKKTW
jgi:hypothetical protein